MKTTIKITTNGYSKKEIKISKQELLKLLGGKEDEEIQFTTYKNGVLNYEIGPKEKFSCNFDDTQIKGTTVCLFSYAFTVIGSKMSAYVGVQGFSLIEPDRENGFVIYGVLPAGVAGCGKTVLAALSDFKKSILSVLSVLLDFAEEIDDIDLFTKTATAFTTEKGDLKIAEELIHSPKEKKITHTSNHDNTSDVVMIHNCKNDLMEYNLSRRERAIPCIAMETKIVSEAFIEETV